MIRTIWCGIIALAMFAPGCGKSEQSASLPGTNKTPTIAVIPKGSTHVFWKSVQAGAEQAGKELGAKIIWKGPLLENDRAQQIGIVEQFVGEDVDGIVLAPLDNVALRRPVADAKAKNIPVVIIDSSLEGEAGNDFVSFVATDNKAGGKMGGEQLAKLLNNKGKIVLLRYGEGSASTIDREQGFLDAIAEHPDMQILVSNRYAGPTMGDAKNAAMQLSDQLRQADGVFCSNESTTHGMLLALQQQGLNKKVKFVGFDTSPPLIDALKAGDIDALVAQNPRKMGYIGVQTILGALRNEQLDRRIDSGAALITSDKLDDPEIQKLLAP